jgi:tetratricopeptide (TPR) repeat protein
LGGDGDDVVGVAGRVRDSAVGGEVVAALDDWASLTKDRERRKWLLAVARGADPDRSRDCLRQPDLWQEQNGARLTRVAQELRVAELSPQLATALGRVLHDGGGEAVPLLTAAQARFPRDFWLNFELGSALYRARRWDEALGYYRAALALRPEAVAVRFNLGFTLGNQGRLDEAIGHFRQALGLDPTHAHSSHTNLGVALAARGRLDEAIGHFREALRLDPTYAPAHSNLGAALHAQGRLEEAIGHFREALRLDPTYAPAHNNLGAALHAQGRLDEAIGHFREALRLDPKWAPAHNSMREALLEAGRFHEARAATQRWLDLLPDDGPQRASVSQQLRRCERLLALEAKLPALLEGKGQPADAAEQRDLAALCQRYKRLYATAARLYAAAFAARPRLADDLRTQDRYQAACAAALAAAGQGADAGKLGDGERARLRRQALGWLTADLAAWAKLIKDSPRERARAGETLRHWQTDSDLAGLRDAGALARLPPAEQEACRKLWAEVDALLRKSGPGK